MKQVRHYLCIHKTKLYLLYKVTKLCWLAAYNLASQEQWHYPCVVGLVLWQKLNLAKFTNGKYSNRWWPVIYTQSVRKALCGHILNLSTISGGFRGGIDAFTIEECWNFDKMQIIFKAVTGSPGHAPWWEGKCGTVWARDAKNHGGSRWLAALESSLC